MNVIEPIWIERAVTARRVRERIESVLDWATARGYRDGPNPAQWRGHLQKLLPKAKAGSVKHFAALDYRQIGSFMAELRRQETVSAKALQFLILTAARTDEARRACWGEVDMPNRVWVVPAERMKSAREHRVPLSSAAMAIVEEMSRVRHSDFLFPGAIDGQPFSAIAMWKTLRRLRAGAAVHGFRSTFRVWAAEETSAPAEIAEMCLAHTVGSAVERAYQRSDLFARRRQLMEQWAEHCDRMPEAEVVPLRRA